MQPHHDDAPIAYHLVPKFSSFHFAEPCPTRNSVRAQCARPVVLGLSLMLKVCTDDLISRTVGMCISGFDRDHYRIANPLPWKAKALSRRLGHFQASMQAMRRIYSRAYLPCKWAPKRVTTLVRLYFWQWVLLYERRTIWVFSVCQRRSCRSVSDLRSNYRSVPLLRIAAC
jgi:hypothetical protein